MKTAVFAYSRQGCQTARRVMALLDGEIRAYTMERFAEDGFLALDSEKELYGENFLWADAMVFVGSCGIAVRKIAPYVKDKQTDPAVIVIDELGLHVISLLSGHIGGANAMAVKLAEALLAVPVITTATDINRRFSVDSWAAARGFRLSDMKMAKTISAEILEHEIPLHSDFPICGRLPNGVVLQEDGILGISVSCRTQEPYSRTLRLIPKILHLGIGCRRGTDAQTIACAVLGVLEENGLDLNAVKCAASIDLKADEAGLCAFCKSQELPVSFYSADTLKTVVGDFTPSEFVKSITGVDNICERAALLGAEKLIVRKQARSGVTVAVAMESLEVCFE